MCPTYCTYYYKINISRHKRLFLDRISKSSSPSHLLRGKEFSATWSLETNVIQNMVSAGTSLMVWELICPFIFSLSRKEGEKKTWVVAQQLYKLSVLREQSKNVSKWVIILFKKKSQWKWVHSYPLFIMMILFNFWPHVSSWTHEIKCQILSILIPRACHLKASHSFTSPTFNTTEQDLFGMFPMYCWREEIVLRCI